MHDEEFESRVLRFEQARRRGPAGIADHLGECTGPERCRLLVELICLDLEYAWQDQRGAEPTALAVYVEQFPELLALDQLPLEIIAEAYRARSRWGDRPSHHDFLAHFAARHEPIREQLLRIDGEITQDSPQPRRESRPTLSSPTDPEPTPDASLRSDRDFLLRRLIGAGRMGKVYVASPRDGEPDVAVKFLRKSLLTHPWIVRRFLGEARTIARLRHPHLVGTGGLGRTAGGSYFIVMDLVVGPNLARVIGLRAIAVDEAVRWVLETCAALEYAHEQGVVHCDLNPANLLLDESGKVRVTDFGLARSLTEETPWAGEIEGTVPFMAPEQASPAWGPIDQRTDIYGIGAVLFALLTGRPPFEGRRVPDVLAQVISAIPVRSPASLSPGLPRLVTDVCLKCLSKSPAARFQSVADLRSALQPALT